MFHVKHHVPGHKAAEPAAVFYLWTGLLFVCIVVYVIEGKERDGTVVLSRRITAVNKENCNEHEL